MRGCCAARPRTPGPSRREEEGEACEDEKETRTPRKSHEHFWQCKRRGDLGIDDPFDESRLHIVLDFTDALIDDFVFMCWTVRTITKLLSPSSYRIVPAHTDANSSTRYPTTTSFFAHLCFYQQMIYINR